MRRRPVPPNLSKVEGTQRADDVPPLTPAQIRELKRRLVDLKDRRRFLLVSAFTARTAFYYDVSRDTWGMNDPSLGTLFKRRATATAVQRLLRDGVQVVRCRVDRRDRLIKKSVPRVRPAWRRKKRGARA
jgi:hypothetical protein